MVGLEQGEQNNRGGGGRDWLNNKALSCSKEVDVHAGDIHVDTFTTQDNH